MGIEFKIREIILEIEYLFLITLVISGISNEVTEFLDKYYICMLFVIFHELSHILVGSLLSKKLSRVFIGISGMTAFFKYDFNIRDRVYYIKETIIYLAGPMSNILIAYFFNDVKFVFEINMFLAILNLLPIYPLDGYNILKNFLYAIFKCSKAIINKIVKIISIMFLLGISIVCVYIFFNFKNIFGIVFFTYILLLNIKNSR